MIDIIRQLEVVGRIAVHGTSILCYDDESYDEIIRVYTQRGVKCPYRLIMA